jgi:hypothetical protein
MTLEDETGTSRVVIMPDFYEKNRMVVLKERFVQLSGEVENHDGVVHLSARNIAALTVSAAETVSHDFTRQFPCNLSIYRPYLKTDETPMPKNNSVRGEQKHAGTAADLIPANTGSKYCGPCLPTARRARCGRPAHTVFGEGPAKAKVIVVGEQHGDKEDLGGPCRRRTRQSFGRGRYRSNSSLCHKCRQAFQMGTTREETYTR